MAAALALLYRAADLPKFVRLSLPLRDAEGDAPPDLAELAARVEALSTAEAPFVLTAGDGTLLALCVHAAHGKAAWAAVSAAQERLGLKLGAAQAHALRTGDDELAAALQRAVERSLVAAGWWRLAGGVLLGEHVVTAGADGAEHTCAALELRVAVAPAAKTLALLAKPSVVRYRCAAALAEPPTPAALAALAARLAGRECRVLQRGRVSQQPCLVDGVRAVGAAEAAALAARWRAAGVPAGAAPPAYVVAARFDDDPDSECVDLPPAAVLTAAGLDTVADTLRAAPVRGVVLRLRDDLAASPFSLWGAAPARPALLGARTWHPGRAPPAPPSGAALYTSAAAVEDAPAPRQQAWQHQLGEPLDLVALEAAGARAPGAAKPKPAGYAPGLQAYLAKVGAEAAEAAARERTALEARRALTPAPATGGARVPLAPAIGSAAPKPKLNIARKPAAAGAATRLPLKAAGLKKAGVKKAGVKKAVPAAGAGADGGGAGDGAAPAPPKAPRAKPAPVDVSGLDVPALLAAGKLTIPQLKAALKGHALPVGGKKGDLEARLKAHLGLAA